MEESRYKRTEHNRKEWSRFSQPYSIQHPQHSGAKCVLNCLYVAQGVPPHINQSMKEKFGFDVCWKFKLTNRR